MDLMHEKTLCTARRKNGTPCRNAPMLGSTVCRMHGGAAPQVRRRAQQRILEASDKAAYRLVQMMQDENIPAAVRLAAARDLLDRANVTGAQQVAVSVEMPAWEKHMADVIVDYTVGKPEVRDAADIIDAEVVEEPDETGRDEELRELENTRLRRKRRGQPPTLPSERAPGERSNPPSPSPSATGGPTPEVTPDWYDPSPSSVESRLRRVRPERRQR